MSSVQRLIEQHWIDKARGLILGAARGELLALVTGPDAPASPAEVLHADTLVAVAGVLANRPEALRGTARDDETVATELGETLMTNGVPRARAVIVGLAALAVTVVEPIRLAEVAARSARAAGVGDSDVDAVRWHAAACALALAGEPYRPADTPRTGQVLDRVAGRLNAAHRTALTRVQGECPDRAALRAGDELGVGDTPLELALTATVALRRHPNDLVRAVAFAIAIGGPAPAVAARAAMTGTLLGARLGLRALPEAGTASLLDPAGRVAAADAATRHAELPLLARPVDPLLQPPTTAPIADTTME